jgi:AraC-like DNA-binding protein
VPAPPAIQLVRPSPPLDRHVAAIWTTTGPVPIAAETVLPNGVVELIFNFGPPHRVIEDGTVRWYRRAWLAGMQQGPLIIASQGRTDLLGVRFRPGGAAALLHVPLRELTDDVVELEQLDGADRTLARLAGELSAVKPSRRVEATVAALSRLLDRCGDRTDPRIRAAVLGLRSAPSLRHLADQVGMSHKHLIDRFHRDVGVAPSRLRRILRFDEVVRTLVASGPATWASLAVRHGYTDQAHLIREFRAFAGVTPTAFLATLLPDQSHLDASANVTSRAPGA